MVWICLAPLQTFIPFADLGKGQRFLLEVWTKNGFLVAINVPRYGALGAVVRLLYGVEKRTFRKFATARKRRRDCPSVFGFHRVLVVPDEVDGLSYFHL